MAAFIGGKKTGEQFSNEDEFSLVNILVLTLVKSCYVQPW
jgi:hypothetical protein